MSIYIVSYLFIWLIFRHGFQVIVDIRNRERKILRRANGGTKAIYIWLLYSIFFIAVSLDVETWHTSTFEKLLGIFIFNIGVFVGGWGLHVLNNSRSYHEEIVALDLGRLVTTGPYRWIRHPMRVGLIMEMIGILIVSGMYVYTIMVVLSVIILHRRTLDEEIFLIDVYGDVYVAYCRNVGKYIPINS